MNAFLDAFIELATVCIYCGGVGLICKVILDQIEYLGYGKEEEE